MLATDLTVNGYVDRTGWCVLVVFIAAFVVAGRVHGQVGPLESVHLENAQRFVITSKRGVSAIPA